MQEGILTGLSPKIMERLGTVGRRKESTWTPIEYERRRAERLNREPGNLTGYDCHVCQNRGYFVRVDDEGRRYNEECQCMITRRNLRYAKESGLGDLLKRCTFGAWQTGGEKWRENLRENAVQYAKNPVGWFLLSGNPGTGKTHICTAISHRLLGDGYPVRYTIWKSVAPRLNATLMDSAAYHAAMEPLKRVRVLYIDDFFKTENDNGQKRRPPSGEINRAFELINERYNDNQSITILSTEWTIEELIDIDGALGSRIYEKAKGHYFDLTGKENWRLRR